MLREPAFPFLQELLNFLTADPVMLILVQDWRQHVDTGQEFSKPDAPPQGDREVGPSPHSGNLSSSGWRSEVTV